jgi:hypothetical protein
MVSLLPEDVMQELDRRFGDDFRSMPEVERLALATAAVEGSVTNSRLKDITVTHPRDLTRTLSGLVYRGFLESRGTGKGTFYVLPGERSGIAEAPFSNGAIADTGTGALQSVCAERSEHYESNSARFGRLKNMFTEIRKTKRVEKKLIELAILKSCDAFALSLWDLSELLGREAATIRIRYLSHLLSEKRLELLYPDKPNHPRQQYRTTAEGRLTLHESEFQSNDRNSAFDEG